MKEALHLCNQALRYNCFKGIWTISLALPFSLALFSLTLFLMMTSKPVKAESASVVQRVALPFDIASDAEQVFCVGKSAGTIVLSRAMLNPFSNVQAAGSADSARTASPRTASPRTASPRTMVGCAFASALDTNGTISVLVNRSGQTPSVFGVKAEGLLEYELLHDSEIKAREQLQKQRQVLVSYQVQVKTQEQILKRLRNDADLIGAQQGFNQIEAKFRTSSEDLSALEREIRNLELSTEQIKSQPAAVNGAAREIEITKQLAELAQAARAAEQSQQQTTNTDSALAESLRLIEETRFDQPDQIRAELVKMRRRRQELLETLQEQTQSAVDYE